MVGKRHVLLGVVVAALLGALSDSGGEARAQNIGIGGSGPCAGCKPGCPPGLTCVGSDDADVDTVGHTIPPGYQVMWGTFAIQLHRGFGSNPAWGQVPNPSSPGNYPPPTSAMFANHYVTAPSGGGPSFVGPPGGPPVSFHVSTKTPGASERFSLTNMGSGSYVMVTANNHFVTFLNQGGIGGLNDGTAPLHTDAYVVGADEKFIVTGLYNSSTGNWISATFKTRTGYYLTAVNGGGIGAPSTGSGNGIIHTDKSSIKPSSPGVQEMFNLLPQ